MLVYIVCVCFLFYVFMSSFGENTTKGKVLNTLGIIIGITAIYYIFTEELTDSFILNVILSVPPALGVLVCLLSVTDKKKDDVQQTTPTSHNPVFNETIIDNEQMSASYSTPNYKYNPAQSNVPYTPPYTQPQTAPQPQPTVQAPKAPICYNNAKIAGYGSCDVLETADFIKITMKSDGKEYEFYVKNQNIVAYRAEGMANPKSY